MLTALLLFSLPLFGADNARPPQHPFQEPGARGEVDWLTVIPNRIPPLCHERGDRWPLILWKSGGYDALSEATIQMLLERGLTQHIKLDVGMIPAAQALQKAGSPIIIMENRTGVWPYNLAGEATLWAHQYPAASLPAQSSWRSKPSLTLFAGWHRAAEQVRDTLGQYKDQGVTVNAVWLDWEGEPLLASYLAARLSPTTSKRLPRSVLADKKAFYRYRRQLWNQLMSAYVAAPVREIFPQVSVTNWVITLSSPERPVLDWHNNPHPPLGPTLFTATTPIAYGIDTSYLSNWKKSFSYDQEHVDRLYRHVILRQVSDDAFNRQQMAPYLNAIPWVARWVPDHLNKRLPVMSRASYREALRHLWLRGVAGMQIYNVTAGIYQEMAIREVEDGVAVYDEMLAYRPFLERGRVMNLDYPGVQASAILWSGLLLEDQAIIRTVRQGEGEESLTIEPWPNALVTLKVPVQGVTYLLQRTEAGNITVTKQPALRDDDGKCITSNLENSQP